MLDTLLFISSSKKMFCNFMLTVIVVCSVMFLNTVFLEAKPFEVTGKNFVYNSTQDVLGNYNFSYEDIEQLAQRKEMGQIVKSKSGKDVLMVKGSYATAFALGDCQTIQVNYTAGEKGFISSFSYREKVTQRKEGEKNMTVSLCEFSYREVEVATQNIIPSDCIKTLTCG